MWILIVATMAIGTPANWQFQTFKTETDCKTAIVGMYQIAARAKIEVPQAMCLPSGFVDVHRAK